MAVPLFAELSRRRVFKTLVGYGVAAFAILQVIEPVMHGLHWPDSVLTYVVIALAIGFPIVTALAWAYDINAWRIERAPAGSVPRGAALAFALAGIALLTAAPVLYLFVRRNPSPPPVEAASIAVLPFVNLSSDKENEYFSDGITEDLINDLANIEGLHVASRTAVFGLKGKPVEIREIGGKLNVRTLLEGSVRREGTALRVTAQLINVADGFHLWSKSYDRELKNIFAVEEEIAASIADALRRKLVGLKPATTSIEAHDLYLKGLFFTNKRNPEALRKAGAFFEQAIAADPRYALAWAGLADATTLRAEYEGKPAGDILPKAKRAAERALEIDPGLAEAHASLGLIAADDLDWQTALREQRKAIDLRPDYAIAHMWHALVLGATGEFVKACAELEEARRLDPTSLIINVNLAYARQGVGDYDGAVEQFRRTLEMDPEFEPARSGLAYVYALRGKSREALAELDRVHAVSNPEHWDATRAIILAMTGRRAEARAIVAAASTLPFSDRAQIAAAMGEKDRALTLLEQSCSAHENGLMLLRMHPAFESLRSEPRFKDVLRCAHLE